MCHIKVNGLQSHTSRQEKHGPKSGPDVLQLRVLSDPLTASTGNSSRLLDPPPCVESAAITPALAGQRCLQAAACSKLRPARRNGICDSSGCHVEYSQPDTATVKHKITSISGSFLQQIWKWISMQVLQVCCVRGRLMKNRTRPREDLVLSPVLSDFKSHIQRCRNNDVRGQTLSERILN